MLFRYDQAPKRVVEPAEDLPESSSAFLALCLIESLDEWFGITHRTLYKTDHTRMQAGYPSVSFPTSEYAEDFGLLTARISREWPVYTFGVAENGEMVGITFSEEDGELIMQQHSISGIWYEDLTGLYLNLQFPDSQCAHCFHVLLKASETALPLLALDWKYADFIKQQRLADPDTTLSFCYVSISEYNKKDETLLRLSGLTQEQKQDLWQQFLEKKVYLPEFEWLWSALVKGKAPDWIEWTLSLYQVLEKLNYQIVCDGNQFRLLDGKGNKVYFGVDHADAAEKILMKILFPLNK